MPSIAIFALIPLFALPLIPVFVLRRKDYTHAREYFIASERTPAGVVQSSCIAYSLQVGIFGYFFSWGARGDFWPAVMVAAMFGAGLSLIYLLRRPLLSFLRRGLAQDRSVTISDFIARHHGNDPRLRVFSAALTVTALTGLICCQASGVASLLPAGPTAKFLTVLGLLAITVLYTVPAGNSGTMRATQVQLGILYFGLVGSILLTLYLLISSAPPMPPKGTFAVVVLAACCAIVLIYRRSRYIDTSPIGRDGDETSHPEPLIARLFRRMTRVLNELIAVLAGITIGFAVLDLLSDSFTTMVMESVRALQAPIQTPAPGLTGLILLPLFYPIVDMTNWLRIAMLETEPYPVRSKSDSAASFKRIIAMYSGGSALVWLIICMFGTIATLATAITNEGNVPQSFVVGLTSQQNEVADAALLLLFVSLFAMAVITMSSMFSASLAVIRYDIVPSVWPKLASVQSRPSAQVLARRRAIIAACWLGATVLMVLTLLDGSSDVSLTSDRFLGLQLVCLCAQLAFIPLVLGPLLGRTSGSGPVTIGPAGAIAVLGVGAASGASTVIACLQTGQGAWLWSAVPACLGSGLLVFAAARLWAYTTTRR